MPEIITTIWRPSHSWKAQKTCSEANACDPYNLYGDQALELKSNFISIETPR